MSPRNARGRPPAAAAGKRHVECPFLSRDSTSNTLTRVFPPLARISQPRVLAVIAAWHAADDPESASAIPRTRSKTPPGPLEEVAGKPMVFHAWHAAHAAKCVTRCVVATDDDAVETTALAFGARVVRVDDTKTKTKNGGLPSATHAGTPDAPNTALSTTASIATAIARPAVRPACPQNGCEWRRIG